MSTAYFMSHVIENDRWWRAKIGRSADRGQTWTFREGPFRSDSWDFAEPDGAYSDSTFLNFGKNNEGARDGFVYNPGLRRYLLATFTRWDGSWELYDAPEPWGQWTTVATYDRWIDATPKFGFTFPPKWMSADGKTLWMVFSGTKAYDSFNAVKGTLRLK